MRCDYCEEEKSVNSLYVFGETWYACKECYEDLKTKGFTDE